VPQRERMRAEPFDRLKMAPVEACPSTSSGRIRHQPHLHDLITVVAAPTQLLSQRSGQIATSPDRQTVQGLIHADVRVLSGLAVTVNGRPGEHLATFVEGNRAEFIFLLRTANGHPRLRLDWFRLVEPGRLAERLLISSRLEVATEVDVRVELACDFAALSSIRAGTPAPPQAFPEPSGDRIGWVHEHLALSLLAEGANLVLSDDHCRLILNWQTIVPAHEDVRLAWQLSIRDARTELSLQSPAPQTTELPFKITNLNSPPSTVDDRLWPWLIRSLEDLSGLWMATRDVPGDRFFAAGAPWYLTLFGRDSIWAARMVLPLDLGPARATLRTLAHRQGTRTDIDAAEEPGKILHELRDGTHGLGTTQLPPIYYGTIDATPLWICLLHDAWRAGLPSAEVTALLPALEKALGWLTDHGDADGDGFLEYIDASGHGLENHCWKDSSDSIRFHDGRTAKGPIAICEADHYMSWAAELATRFRAKFWCGTGNDRYPALALDGAKDQVDSLTSNIGHLLGTGILNAEEELLIARQVTSPALDSGLGLRTMAVTDAGYDPLSYHCGSVWPHDTAIVIAGLVRAGLAQYAGGLIEGLLRASVAFEQRLPELWSGEGRPVPYPSACRPQAWSAAAAVVVAHAVNAL
jgi:glycogen debranching enzyme